MSTATSQDVVAVKTLQEAFELYNLETNSSLLNFGLNMGLIEKTTNNDMTMNSLNIKLMSESQVIQSVLLEVLMRLGIYLSATGLVKLSIQTDFDDPDTEDTLRGFYILSVVVHQLVNFQETSTFRSLNRALMSIAIILFSITTTNTKPCQDMKEFMFKIRHRLWGDYYLWMLLFAIDLVLTCSSPILLNIEQFYGLELNISNFITAYCVIHLAHSMQMIGNGRLTPLIVGTPLLFLDAGDNITLVKGLFLTMYYLCFWCSDWRELVDWHHSLIHDAGVCKIFNQSPNKRLRLLLREARQKFDDWRLEEGLDDEGWFLLLDAPPELPQQSTRQQQSSTATNRTNPHQEDDQPNFEELEVEGENEDREEEDEQHLDYAGRVIYLQSRNPLLVWLATIILIVWK